MKRPALTLVTLVLAMGSGQATAESTRDGRWLLTTCTEDRINCLAFMAGARDQLRDSGSLRCVSEYARLWELQKAYVTYANEHPNDLDSPAIEVAERAFDDGPACRETSASARGYQASGSALLDAGDNQSRSGRSRHDNQVNDLGR